MAMSGELCVYFRVGEKVVVLLIYRNTYRDTYRITRLLSIRTPNKHVM